MTHLKPHILENLQLIRLPPIWISLTFLTLKKGLWNKTYILLKYLKSNYHSLEKSTRIFLLLPRHVLPILTIWTLWNKGVQFSIIIHQIIFGLIKHWIWGNHKLLLTIIVRIMLCLLLDLLLQQIHIRMNLINLEINFQWIYKEKMKDNKKLKWTTQQSFQTKIVQTIYMK